MSELNSFCKKVKSVAGKAVKKTGEFADLAAKYVRLHSMDSKLDDRYEMLGRLTYKQLKTGESQAEKIAAYIESIDKIRADRKALQAEIDAEKAKREVERSLEDAVDEIVEDCADESIKVELEVTKKSK